MRRIFLITLGLAIAASGFGPFGVAHEHSRPAFENSRRIALLNAKAITEDVPKDANQRTCQLTLRLVDDQTNKTLPGLIRVTNLKTGKHVALADHIQRDQGWYSVAATSKLVVPRTKLRVEAVVGLETELASQPIDTSQKAKASISLRLKSFYDADSKGLQSGNTHVHLMKLTLAEAQRYLQLVPRADDLDLVFVSHLLRVPDDVEYISNMFVLNSLKGGGDLNRLSQTGVLFGNGEEHRHNFGTHSEGYGHVMLLNIQKLIEPVSIGPGIMKKGTDGIPLQRGIKTARDDGATVIWCHNHFGMEDVPNWVSGLIDAQNIFDGGDHGSYDRSFYRYLNIGLKVPFSTGTDWFIYDFSRVYVPIIGKLTVEQWLKQVAQGRTFITNGPLLEFCIGPYKIGDTIKMSGPGELKIDARALGRNDFANLEVVHNGKVVHAEATKKVQGHFEAQIQHTLKIGGPGWLATRIPDQAGKNEFGKRQFAHTSPIYIEMTGQRIFDPDLANELIQEIESNIEAIHKKALFADDSERKSVEQVHQNGIQILRRRLTK